MQGPAALQKQALSQAQAMYAPQLDALRAEQADARRQAQANLIGIQKLIQVVKAHAQGSQGDIDAAFQHGAGADYGPSDMADQARGMYGAEGDAYAHHGDISASQAGLAGQAEYLNQIQDSNKIARDLLNEVAKVQGQIPGAAHDIYGDLLSGQDKYRDFQVKQQKMLQDQYDRQYRKAKDQASMLNKGPWLYYVVDSPQGPQVRLAKDKKGQPISTTGLSDYQKARLEASAAKSATDAATDAAKPGKTHQNADGTYSTYNPDTGRWELSPGYNPKRPVKKTTPKKLSAKIPPIIDPDTGQPLTSSTVKMYKDDVYGLMSNHPGDFEGLLSDLKESPIPPAIWEQIISKRFQIPQWAIEHKSPNITGLRQMAVPRLHRIAVFLGYEPPDLNTARPGRQMDPKRPWLGLSKAGLIEWILHASGPVTPGMPNLF
jgi:hypothetical protein